MATPRQRKAAQKAAENVRKAHPKPIGTILRESGYSKSTSEKPKRVTASKGFNELMEEYLPEQDVARVHRELLHSNELQNYIFPLSLDDKEIQHIVESVSGCRLIRIKKLHTSKYAYYWAPKPMARKDGIDMAYKLRGKYKPTQLEVRTFVGWTPKELEAYAVKGIIPTRFADESQGP